MKELTTCYESSERQRARDRRSNEWGQQLPARRDRPVRRYLRRLETPVTPPLLAADRS